MFFRNVTGALSLKSWLKLMYLNHFSQEPILESPDDSEKRKELGPWMCAAHAGRRVRVPQQGSSSMPREDRFQKTRGSLPCDVTELLAALSVNISAPGHHNKVVPPPSPDPKSASIADLFFS
ncbi:hypothetical protein SESBI_46532 [Sesbania bispinosa]|nr:hypothetical protein SESBI_46532 [Sesbania bispinosa]